MAIMGLRFGVFWVKNGGVAPYFDKEIPQRVVTAQQVEVWLDFSRNLWHNTNKQILSLLHLQKMIGKSLVKLL